MQKDEEWKKKWTHIGVIIFYSHMLHFALNVQVILSGQTQKVWVSTYSNVLYSLFIHTGEPQELSVTRYTHYSSAIWLRSFTKWVLQNEEEEKLRKAACTNLKGSCLSFFFFFLSVNFFFTIPRCSTLRPSIENQMSAVRWVSLQKIWMLILQARLDKFPLFQKNKMIIKKSS